MRPSVAPTRAGVARQEWERWGSLVSDPSSVQGGWYRGTAAGGGRHGLVPSAKTAPTRCADDGGSMFTPMPNQIDLPALEHEVLRRWRESKVFERSLAATQGRPQWTFYEGPPTANGMPGTHHVEARVFKDLFPALQDHEGLPRPAQGGLGLPRPTRRTPGRARTRAQRQEGHRGIRHRRVQRQVPSLSRATRRRVREAHRADGLLGRHVQGLPHDGRELRRERLVVAQDRVRQGPARIGLSRGAVLPPLWHGAVRPRGRPGVSRTSQTQACMSASR